MWDLFRIWLEVCSRFISAALAIPYYCYMHFNTYLHRHKSIIWFYKQIFGTAHYRNLGIVNHLVETSKITGWQINTMLTCRLSLNCFVIKPPCSQLLQSDKPHNHFQVRGFVFIQFTWRREVQFEVRGQCIATFATSIHKPHRASSSRLESSSALHIFSTFIHSWRVYMCSSSNIWDFQFQAFFSVLFLSPMALCGWCVYRSIILEMLNLDFNSNSRSKATLFQF